LPLEIKIVSKGVEINDLDIKLSQFAEDTTAVLSGLNSARALSVYWKSLRRPPA